MQDHSLAPASESELDMLLKSIEKHLREHGIAAAQFGRAALRDPSFVFELRRGREPRPRTVQRVQSYIRTTGSAAMSRPKREECSDRS